MSNKYPNCPNCKDEGIVVSNGSSISNGRNKKIKKKYKCTRCNKSFVYPKETLTRTEIRLFSLLYNLIEYDVKQGDTLKIIAKECNKEVPKIGQLDFEAREENIDLSTLDNIKMVICSDGDYIKIIKPKQISISIEDIKNTMQKMLD